MAEIEVNVITLLELANRTHNKQYIDLVNSLVKAVPMLEDAVWTEANDLTSHATSTVAVVPTASLRGANEGVIPTAGQTKKLIEHISTIEDHSMIDEYLVKKAPDPVRFRYDEDLLHMEGVKNKFGTLFFYGSHTTDLKEINGLATRYNASTKENVRLCGGSGSDVSSLWMVGWGLSRVHLVYPLGSAEKVIQRNDMGRWLVRDSSTARQYFAWVTQFILDFGLVVRDDRYVQRLANIETSGTSNILDIDLLIDMYNDLPSTDGVVIYCHKKIKSQFDKLAKDKPNVVHTMADPFGKPQLYFWDIPIKKTDSLLDTESAIS